MLQQQPLLQQRSGVALQRRFRAPAVLLLSQLLQLLLLLLQLLLVELLQQLEALVQRKAVRKPAREETCGPSLQQQQQTAAADKRSKHTR